MLIEFELNYQSYVVNSALRRKKALSFPSRESAGTANALRARHATLPLPYARPAPSLRNYY